MMSERAQRADDVFDFILLKQADPGDTGRSRFQARGSVSDSDAAESENGDFRPAGFSQGGEPGRLRSRSAGFFRTPEQRRQSRLSRPRRGRHRRPCDTTRPPGSRPSSGSAEQKLPAHGASPGVTSSACRWTPSAPLASATSVRELMTKRVCSLLDQFSVLGSQFRVESRCAEQSGRSSPAFPALSRSDLFREAGCSRPPHARLRQLSRAGRGGGSRSSPRNWLRSVM